MTERLFTKPFLLVSVANFTSGMAYALFLHFSGYLADLGASDCVHKNETGLRCV